MIRRRRGWPRGGKSRGDWPRRQRGWPRGDWRRGDRPTHGGLAIPRPTPPAELCAHTNLDTVSKRPLGRTRRGPQHVLHSQQSGRLASCSRCTFARSLQSFVQALIKPSSILCRISHPSNIMQQMETQMVLRSKAVKRKHQRHMLAIQGHRCLGEVRAGSSINTIMSKAGPSTIKQSSPQTPPVLSRLSLSSGPPLITPPS